tara:strand:- start:581 stop:973 length:393 start_codon:yes stop_codon:yes gene_type:complete
MQSKTWEAGPQSTSDTTIDRLTAGNKQPEPKTTQVQPALSTVKVINDENTSQRDLAVCDTDSSPSNAQEQRDEKTWDKPARLTPSQDADGSVSSAESAEHIYPEGGLRAWLVVFGSVSPFPPTSWISQLC